MKRIMLASGPWMQEAADEARRVVLYDKGTELVVHNQTFSAGMPFGQQITFTDGNYFGKGDIAGALKKWEDRNRAAMASEGDEPWRVASYDLATAANAADLAQQYYRERPNDRPEDSDDVPMSDEANLYATLTQTPITVGELAEKMGKPEAMVRGQVKLHDPNNLPENDNAEAITEAQQHWDTLQNADGRGLVLDDDNLLAEYFSERFGVKPTDVYAEYSGDGEYGE